jgi:hypothetical protein
MGGRSGISVKNLQLAEDYYKSLGGKPSDFPSFVLDSSKYKELETYGKIDAPPWKIKIKMFQLGPLTLELTEPIEGGNYNETYMVDHGEGANHIAYLVDDLEKEVKELQTRGVQIMYHINGIYAYLDTRVVGGLVLELFQKGVDIRQFVNR